MLCKTVFLTTLVVLWAEGAFSFPLHASCKIAWKLPTVDCDAVTAALVHQISVWNNTNCGSGEKCRYGLTSSTAGELKAKHVTPTKNYVDDLTFTFTTLGAGGGCQASGYSTSETWYAVLDYSTNYCNLHNLITGAGLSNSTGFVEDTSDSVCTQYSKANCEKY